MIWAAAALALMKAYYYGGGAGNRDLIIGGASFSGFIVTVVRLSHSPAAAIFGTAVSFSPSVSMAVPAASSERICLWVGSHHSYFILTVGARTSSTEYLDKAITSPYHMEGLEYDRRTFSPPHITHV